MSTVIQVNDLWKEYRLGVIGHGTLAQDLHAWWAKMRGKEDPNEKIGRPVWDRKTSKATGDRFWALNDINFTLASGDVFGIIGKNGSGKSTLLKILSRVTAPTRGIVRIKGRMASLLEVGTGFHPELTGRENIFLNAAILGMSKMEVKDKLDEIIDFSGVEAFIDTPVKRYSSGMYVRLAFAVAAHLDAEILVIDEVLAVGDVEFQKRCLGKMESISRDGRTILFVSHNLAAVKSLCNKGVVLANGTLTYSGSAEDAVEFYSGSGITGQTEWRWENVAERPGNGLITLKRASLKPLRGDIIDTDSGMVFECAFGNELINLNLGLVAYFLTNENYLLFTSEIVLHTQKDSKKGEYTVRCTVPPKFLNSGHYNINLHFRESRCHMLLRLDDIISFTVDVNAYVKSTGFKPSAGVLVPQLEWDHDFVE
ncbi:MAG: ABC transporter ATP-binding protein [Desulfobulbaceae bacterium]|nr:ABC transporter ATP-binding protein [Desulfobulbaceae bacterium]